MSSRPMSGRETDDRGQIFSSYAALAAVVAIVAGLVVLLTTRDDKSAAGPQPPAQSTGQSIARASSTPTSSAPVITPSPSVISISISISTSTPAPTASPTETTSTSRPTTTATRIPASDRPAVEVYNNTRRKGLADQVGDKARAVGWTVTGADNWRGKIVASTVYYPAGMQDAATELARVLGISRTKDALANMKKDRLSVILTSDYAG